jgi:hypothetical protein
MRKLKKWGRGFVAVITALTMAVSYPGLSLVSADEATPNTVTTSAPSSETPTNTPPPETTPPPATTEPTPTPEPAATTPPAQGPSEPNGAGSNTYVENPETGIWENDQYIWDPVTKKTTPKTTQEYSYNPTTGMWDTTQYVYDAPSGSYVPNVVSAAQPPEGSLTTSGPNSPITANSTSGNDSIYNNFYNAAISNKLNSQSTTGDTLANGNTTVGNLLSGNASSMANIINLLQSSASFANGGNLTTFSKDIQGNVIGDLLINPNELAKLGTVSSAPASKLTINNQSSGAINNDVNLHATSGDASADSNTTVGNIKTGNADAVANVVNVINGAIAANQSFLGAINIYGSLDGDILLPPGFIDSLLASNNTPSGNTTVNSTTTQGINNAITSNASTGSATAGSNTSTGNIGTGNAANNVTILNLTGSNVVAANNLLVFVNVLGKWYGVIMNAPNSATAASIAGGVTSHTNGSTDTTVNNNTDSQINNNITVGAKTGDASATNNTKVGSVQSGNATTSVNLANLINSNLSLSDWFGVLFINVFGSWNGSFGVDTIAGNPTAPVPSTPGSNQNTTPTVQAFRFVPKELGDGAQRYALSPIESDAQASSSSDQENSTSTTLGSTTNNTPTPTAPKTIEAAQSNQWLIPALGLLAGAILLGIERLLSLRNSKRGNAPAIKPAAA